MLRSQNLSFLFPANNISLNPSRRVTGLDLRDSMPVRVIVLNPHDLTLQYPGQAAETHTNRSTLLINYSGVILLELSHHFCCGVFVLLFFCLLLPHPLSPTSLNQRLKDYKVRRTWPDTYTHTEMWPLSRKLLSLCLWVPLHWHPLPLSPCSSSADLLVELCPLPWSLPNNGGKCERERATERGKDDTPNRGVWGWGRGRHRQTGTEKQPR